MQTVWQYHVDSPYDQEDYFFKSAVFLLKTSKGCILFVMWGANDRNSTLFPIAKSKALMCIRDLWLSRTSRTFLVTVGWTCSKTNCSHWRNGSPLIYPLSVQEAWHPVGAPSRSHSCMHFQTNMRNDRLNKPAVLQQQITIVSCPFPGLAIMPTCFFPVVKQIFGELFVEVCISVSSML